LPIDLQKACRRLALQHHPDRNKGSAKSTERFKAIGVAYEVLSDPAQRAAYYDANLKGGESNSTITNTASTGTSVDTGRYRHAHYADPFVSLSDSKIYLTTILSFKKPFAKIWTRSLARDFSPIRMLLMSPKEIVRAAPTET
jgi:curved DNA-binding protein CbpA